MRALAENLGNRTPDRDRLREETRARPRTSADLTLDARAIDFHWKDLRVFAFLQPSSTDRSNDDQRQTIKAVITIGSADDGRFAEF
jgi:hypothetical protein